MDVDLIRDIFHGLGHIEVKRMFGAHGVYADGIFFAIADDGVLYLKADDDTAPLFHERGLEPFAFVKDGKVVKTSYYSAPEEVLEDPEEAIRWGRRAIEAALRAASRKAPGRRSPPARRAR